MEVPTPFFFQLDLTGHEERKDKDGKHCLALGKSFRVLLSWSREQSEEIPKEILEVPVFPVRGGSENSFSIPNLENSAMTTLPASSASWVELSCTKFWAWDKVWKWRIKAMGIWDPRITCTWVQTDNFGLFPSYWAVQSRSLTCLQLLLRHSPVPGVADAARRKEVEQQSCFPRASWDESWLLSCVLA